MGRRGPTNDDFRDDRSILYDIEDKIERLLKQATAEKKLAILLSAVQDYLDNEEFTSDSTPLAIALNKVKE